MTRIQRLAGGSIAALVAIAVVTVLVRHDSKADEGRGGPREIGGEATSTTTAGGPGQQASANTATTAPSKTVAPPADATWHLPAVGTYRYHYSRTGPGPTEYDSSFTVTHTGSRTYDERRTQQGAVITRHYTSDKEGLQETAFTLAAGNDQPHTCTWDHPVNELPAKPTAGAKLHSNASCAVTLNGQATTIKIDSTATVVGFKEAKVGNDTVKLLRVDLKTTSSTTTANGTVTRTSTSIEYFDLARGLLAQSTEDATESGPSGQSTFRVVEAMLTLQPEVR